MLSCSVWRFATPRTAACQAPLSMGILQARILVRAAMLSSRVSSQPRGQTQVSHIAGRFFTDWATREALSDTEKKKPIAWLCFAALSLMVYKAQEPVRWSQLLFVWSLLFLSASKRWWIWLTGEDYLQGELEKKKLVTVIADVPSWRRS